MIPWIGGKRRLAKDIIPLFPEHTCYVEPFAGGAAILFAKEPSKVEVLNDINGDLVNLYRVTKHHLDEFVLQFRNALVSRQIYEWLKDTPPETLTDIQRAARFFYLQKMNFSGQVSSFSYSLTTSVKPKLDVTSTGIRTALSTAHLRLARVQIENLDWTECIKKFDRPHTLFYCDPPYYETAGYGVPFPRDEYVKLADLMKTMNGKAIVSLNAHPEIKKIFKGLKMKTVGIKYSVANKTRSGKESKELIIRNF